MGFKEIVTLDADTTISLGGFNKKIRKDNPTSVEGYYLGNRKVESKKAKAGFCYIHFLQTPKGNVGVWGKTDLDRKLLQVVPGTMIRASFDKMVPTPNGEMYKFRVETDRDNTIDVSGITSVSDSYESNEEEGSAFGSFKEPVYSSQDDEEEEDNGYDAAAQLAAAKEQAAKVRDILSKNKTKN